MSTKLYVILKRFTWHICILFNDSLPVKNTKLKVFPLYHNYASEILLKKNAITDGNSETIFWEDWRTEDESLA